MTTDVDYKQSTAGQVLRGLREPPGESAANSEDPDETPKNGGSELREADKGSLSRASSPAVRASKPRNERFVTASRRFQTVNWSGEPEVAADSEPVSRPAESQRMSLTASERFRAVAWDPAEHQRVQEEQRKRDQELAEQRAQALKLKNFFGKARF